MWTILLLLVHCLALVCVFTEENIAEMDTTGESNEKDKTLDATDSDYLFIETRDTSLPHADKIGLGVFAKYDIPKDEIICEYRGPIIENTIENTATFSHHVYNKLMDVKVSPDDGISRSLMGAWPSTGEATCICAQVRY